MQLYICGACWQRSDREMSTTAYLANDIPIGEPDDHTVLWSVVLVLVLSH